MDATDEIMERFDFDEVYKAMKCLRREWAHKDGGMRVPSLVEIKTNARDLLERIERDYKNKPDRGHGSTSTGGFEAYWRRWDDGELEFGLSFILSEWQWTGSIDAR